MSANAPLLIFAHANSFPASTYGKLFAALQGRGLAVQEIEALVAGGREVAAPAHVDEGRTPIDAAPLGGDLLAGRRRPDRRSFFRAHLRRSGCVS